MATPSWLRFGGRNNEQNTDETQGEFDPSKFQSALEESTKTQLAGLETKFQEQLAPLSEISEYIRAQKAREAQIETNKRQAQQTEETSVDDDLWITNPQEASRRTNLPVLQQTQAVAAITMRREVLGDKEYYHGAFKDEVDALIEQQPLASRANSMVLNNAYLVVLGKHANELAEGKLKSRASLTSFDGKQNGVTQEQQRLEAEGTLTNEEKVIAARFGLTEKEWVSSRKELEYV